MQIIYIGDANNLLKRIKSNHSSGNVEGSALRQHIAEAMGYKLKSTKRPSGSTRIRIDSQEPRQGAPRTEDPALRGQAGRGAPQTGRRTKEQDRLRRPQSTHPHLQLPRKPRHRPPHQPDSLQARQHFVGQLAPGHRRIDGIRAAGATGSVRAE